jgi:hypothetical protein
MALSHPAMPKRIEGLAAADLESVTILFVNLELENAGGAESDTLLAWRAIHGPLAEFRA